MRHRVKQGQVFEIPISDELAGYGQVIARRPHVCFVVVFERSYPRTGRPDLSQILEGPIRFAADCLDAKLVNGDWPVVGLSMGNIDQVGLPVYKTSSFPSGEWFVESWDGRTRPATLEERDRLHHRTMYSPMVLESALKAIHGAGPWPDVRETLEYDYVRQTRDIRV